MITMQKLKDLGLNHLSEAVLKRLTQNHIITLLDFLQEDEMKLSALTKLRLNVILSVRAEILTKFSAPIINGTTLLKRISETRTVLNTGILSLDSILLGGIPVGYITELCGLAGSGKTQLSLQLAVNCARRLENTILYIDTKGDFSAIRIQKILDANGCSHKDMAEIMYRIRVVHIWTMEDLVELFKSLNDKTLIINNLALIIVDSLPCLMMQYIGDENKIGFNLLNTLVNYSRFIGNQLNVGIIYINVQTRWIDNDILDVEDDDMSSALREPTYIEKRNRCLGKYWQNIPAVVLLLEKLEDSATDKDSAQIKVTVINSNIARNVNSQCFLNLNALGVI
ncbi:unnamed protein product [Chrysodeixis includens]|uniref:RecA family profile 1 domain-containing protein n=1 Tax=Chrysodeixis includens TaxID=689277 RepID=A0A9N8KYN3_CHRIL|nr:unnamed protein product [Chrysodeixis includens]